MDHDPELIIGEVIATSGRHFLLFLFLGTILFGVGWLNWPTIRSHLMTASADPSRVDTQSSPVSTSTVTIHIEEDVSNWHVYHDETFGFDIRYPSDWIYQQKSPKDIDQSSTTVLSAFELTPQKQNDAQPRILVHVEDNPNKQVALSFGSLHPARGTNRTPYLLHGLPAVKYQSILVNQKMNRWTTFVQTASLDKIVVLEFLSPITLDDFDPLYSQAERIITTYDPKLSETQEKAT